MKLGETAEALAPLKQAESRGVTEASQMLAEYALEQYDVEQADAHLDKWARRGVEYGVQGRFFGYPYGPRGQSGMDICVVRRG